MVRHFLVCLTLLFVPLPVMAQGMRVSTNVFDLQNPTPTGNQNLVSTSLSLFHNGRVYDSVDFAEEVVILDPAEKKFTVLNTSRKLKTTLNFEEMRRMLETRTPAVEKYIQEVVEKDPVNGQKVSESLRFQLHPSFERSFDPASGVLTLSSPSFRYKAETRSWEDASLVEKYLAYADWTCQLNHLMRPNSMFPEPRMKLNAALRELEHRIPVSVELDLTPNDSLRLRAEHRFTEGLEDDDRRRIAHWEELLNSESIRSLPFRSYQQTVLVTRRK
jgi:hypothetical protein